ncbi:MAG: desulfoferrodoxin [Clostridia bacterium]|nr:desulfoferrodoxin [Clostridia bacterium]
MNDNKFYICERCGNLVGMIHASGVSMVCCGQKMTPLTPGTTDASVEKHVPVALVSDDTVTVKVGSVTHPQSPEHYIAWIYLETNRGGQRVALEKDGEPAATFKLAPGEKAVAVYAYCNLHGLWKSEI